MEVFLSEGSRSGDLLVNIHYEYSGDYFGVSYVVDKPCASDFAPRGSRAPIEPHGIPAKSLKTLHRTHNLKQLPCCMAANVDRTCSSETSGVPATIASNPEK